VHEARRIALRRHVEAARGVGRRDETQRGVCQPILLHGRQPIADLVLNGSVGMADDVAQILDGGDLATHGYIMLA
jgi:hypothetical protein